MKITLRQHGPNQTKITLDDRSIFFSYETPVIVRIDNDAWYQTSEKHSATTSRHVKALFGSWAARVVSQGDLERLANGGKS